MSAIDLWLPHQPPFRFVDEMVAVVGDTGEFTLRLASDDSRLGRGHLQPLLLVEALAQCAAAFNGYTNQGGTESGVLVEMQASLRGAAKAGDVVRLRIQRLRQHGPLARFSGSAQVGDQTLATAEFMVMRTNPQGEVERG